jgi:glucose/arabinose dehydrogenase/PKD repeat protein
VVLVSVAVLIGGFVAAASARTSATANLVAAYAFNEGSGTAIADASGNGQNGTAANTTWAATGKYGGALTFNGSSSRVTVPDSPLLHLTTAMTLEAWVNSTGTNAGWRDLVYKGNDNYYLSASSTPNNRPAAGGIMGGSYGEVFGVATLPANTWTHLAVTYDGTTLRLYVNGTQVSNLGKTGNLATSTNPLSIGSDPIYGQYFQGLVDEVRIYNTALSSSEIQADMATPISVGTGDTQPPSQPGTLTATAINSGRVDLSWGAATDNVAVTGYRIERCQTAGCSNFTQIAAPPGAVTSYGDTNAAAGTSYSYRVRAVDAVPNLGPYSNTATASTPNGSGPTPVAAFAFDEGSGSSVADASGGGNNGSLTGTTWATNGKYGKALNFNGSSSRVTIADAPSLHLANAMTLEAWVYPTVVNSGWRDILYKGNDNYYLSATTTSSSRPAGGGIIGGSYSEVFGTAALPANSWAHLAVTYDGAALRLYVNGTQVSTTAKTGGIATSTNPLTIGSDPIYGQYFQGMIDDIRVYDSALTGSQIQTDMNTPVSPPVSDTTPPTAAISSPADGATVQDVVNVSASANDNVGVANVELFVDGLATGIRDQTAPYDLAWDSRTISNGNHTLRAQAKDGAGNATLSAPVTVTVSNTAFFQTETLATGFTLPTSFVFLPDGRMLVAEMPGTVKILPPPYTQPDPTPLLQLTNISTGGPSSGIYGLMNIAVDPNFTSNHFLYVFYTLQNPLRTRLSRFTANSAVTGTVPGSETVLYQDSQDAGADHHAGAIAFANDGTLLFTTGDEFGDAGDSQRLTSPRGKIHRINRDGTIPIDNPFYDGAGPNVDSIWALGLRNPFRAYYDSPTGRLFVGDVGGNDYSTAVEEIDLGKAGANYGWPNCEGPCAPPNTSPLYSYPHNGREAAVVSGFVYHGSQFPSSYEGSFFFADYALNWIKRLTLDPSGNVTGVFNFEPPDGSPDGPTGNVVCMAQGPEGALYYLDIGFDDNSSTVTLSKIRRIRYVQSGNQPPVAASAADQTSGPAPLTVNFSSAGSSDPDGQPLSYTWDFGDGATSNAANPSHAFAVAGQYTVRLAVSDGVSTTFAAPIAIRVGNAPTATILSPQDGATFRAGDVISFSGDATDIEDGSLPASAYTWDIDFLHEGHVHPGTPQTGFKSGTFTIPTTGHDFSGNTRYRISLTARDSSGLTTTTSVIIWPQKVNLTFNTTPAGLTLYLDGIAKVTPFVYDTLIGFNHTIEARNQTSGTNNYTFAAWSDDGAQQHTIVVPSAAQTYTATYSTSSSTPVTPQFVQVAASTPQTPQTTVATTFAQPQRSGDLNVVVVGWDNTTSNVVSVSDSAGNTYQLAAPTKRSGVNSQAIYYAKNVAAGANTVRVTMNTSTPFIDVRIAEYSGVDSTNPLDATSSGSGRSAQPDSGVATMTTARELLIGAGTTTGHFNAAGSGYTTRIITSPDGDILEDRVVTTIGSYTANASSNNSNWVMQLVTFRAAGQ